MGFWSRLFGGEGKSGQSVSTSLDLFREIYGGRESRAGVTVNWATALEVATVLACVRVIANGISQVPFRLYQDDGAGKKIAKDHQLNKVISTRPNPWQTSYEFRETLAFHVLLTWNAYVFVNRVGSKREVRELIPIPPNLVTVEQKRDFSLVYKVAADNGRPAQEFGQDAIWHLRGPSWNSWVGMDAIKLARDAIGLTAAIERGQSEFHKNGAKTSGLYSVQEKLSPEKYALLRKWFEEELAKSDSYRPLILDQGADFKSFTMTGVDQQLIETRKLQIEEICREFNVMPIMVGHGGDNSPTYASAEQFFLAHVVHTLMPWYQRIEQSADVNLLSEAEIEQGYYTKFNANALMRGAAKDRAEYFAKALGAGGTKGWMTQNDVRELEDMDRSTEPEADELPQPTTKQPTEASAEE